MKKEEQRRNNKGQRRNNEGQSRNQKGQSRNPFLNKRKKKKPRNKENWLRKFMKIFLKINKWLISLFVLRLPTSKRKIYTKVRV